LVSSLYDTVGAPDRWDTLLDRLTSLTRSDNASLQHYNKQLDRQVLAIAHNLDEEAMQAFDEYYAGINYWLEKGIPLGFYEPGHVVVSNEFVSDRELKETEFGSDFAIPNDAAYSLGMTIAENRRYSTMFSLQRGLRKGGYDPEDRRLFELLVPHFQRVLELEDLVSEARQSQQALHVTLNRLPLGVLLVKASAWIVLANDTGRRLLSDRDGLASSGRYLTGATMRQTRVLQERIARAAETTGGWGTDPGGVLSLRRPSGSSPLTVLVTPLPREEFYAVDPEPLAAVLVSDPERPDSDMTASFRQLYGLTTAEARLAEALVRGHDVPGAARELGIAYETARNHLKRVLSKTGAHHQNELLRLLLSGPGRIQQ
jgi:DNA-binding CsgD family transcriptional regulator